MAFAGLFLRDIGAPASAFAYEAMIEATLDALAVHLEKHVDIDRLLAIAVKKRMTAAARASMPTMVWWVIQRRGEDSVSASPASQSMAAGSEGTRRRPSVLSGNAMRFFRWEKGDKRRMGKGGRCPGPRPAARARKRQGSRAGLRSAAPSDTSPPVFAGKRAALRCRGRPTARSSLVSVSPPVT